MRYTDGGTQGTQGKQIMDFAKKLGGLMDLDPGCEKWLLSGSQSFRDSNEMRASLTAYVNLLDTTNLMGWAVMTPVNSNETGVINATTGNGYRRMTIVFNERGSFFQSSHVGRSQGVDYASQIGGIRPGTDRQRGLKMLHEFAHSLGSVDFGSDDGNQAAVNRNNDLIWKNCNITLMS